MTRTATFPAHNHPVPIASSSSNPTPIAIESVSAKHASRADQMSVYVRAAVEAEIEGLRRVVSGRACATFRAAAAVGGFVGVGAVEWADAVHLLLHAAEETGLSQREALGHINRGLRQGQTTPRDIPGRHACRARSYLLPAPFDESLHRPPGIEVEAIWDVARPVGSDPEVAAWFGRRFGNHAACFMDLTELWDLARAIPVNLDLPRWAWSRGGPWTQSGHRVLFRLWDHSGQGISLRARCVDPGTVPKSLAPSGFSVKCLVLADPLAVQLLSGDVPDWWEPREVIVAEGEPDWLLWAARQPDTEAQGPACFGIEAGAWSQKIGDRIPDGSRVAVRTHLDEPGERYARQIATTLHGRCHVFRSRGGEEATR